MMMNRGLCSIFAAFIAVFFLAAPYSANAGEAIARQLMAQLPNAIGDMKNTVAPSKTVKGDRVMVSKQFRSSDGQQSATVLFNWKDTWVSTYKPYATNDSRAKSAGYKILTIAGRKFILKEQKAGTRKAYFLHSLISNNLLVTIQGFAQSSAPFEALAKTVKYDALAKVK